jgi:hypothetical protein
MKQPILHRRTLMVLVPLIASVAVVWSVVEQRRQQVAGFCDKTGVRLSDSEVLRHAESYVASLRAAEGQAVRLSQVGSTTVKIVSEAALRAEEQVPAWVKRTGGFRAYVEVVNPQGTASDQSSRPNLIVISNCGEFRLAVYEYFGGWLW